jgi:hypothetical protein
MANSLFLNHLPNYLLSLPFDDLQFICRGLPLDGASAMLATVNFKKGGITCRSNPEEHPSRSSRF